MAKPIPAPTEITLTVEEVSELQVSFKKLGLLAELPPHLTGNPLAELIARQQAMEIVEKTMQWLGVKVGVLAENEEEGESIAIQLERAKQERTKSALADDERNDPDRQ